MNFIFVALGGGLGAILRSLVSNKWNTGSYQIPKGTWIANISGSLVLAILISLRLDEKLSEEVWLFAGVGICGAYTTFSTFGKETVHLFLNGHYNKAVIYVLLSLFFSLISVITVFLIFNM